MSQLTQSPAHPSRTSQRKFIGTIAHDLRTSIAIIKLNSEVALLDSALTNEARQTFEDTIEELNRAALIINTLLGPGQISAK
jgi:signal transduction histidine kinase